MANIKSAKKRARQSIENRTRNVMLRSRAYTFLKKARKALEQGGKDVSQIVQVAMREIDMMVPKGIFHKNKAARLKSSLHAKLKKASA